MSQGIEKQGMVQCDINTQKAEETELIPLLKLNFAKGIGYHKAYQLLAKCSPKRLAQANDLELLALGLTITQLQNFRSVDDRLIEQVLKWHSQPNQWVISLYDPLFSSLLKLIPSAPLLLFVKGDPLLLNQPQIAIVGSRHATLDGQQNAYQFAQELAIANYVITSGLAIGIDTQAHQGALDIDGKTIAVLGSGIDMIYPKQNQKLAEKIIAQGALVSEFLPNTAPRSSHFPQRNRIVSGLSLGVLVVEATQRSGSLITARYALEQGREVFAVPGMIHSGMNQGCHDLIRSGAKLVDKSDDIFDELASLNEYLAQQQFTFQSALSSDHQEDDLLDQIAEIHNKEHCLLKDKKRQNEQLDGLAVAQDLFSCDTKSSDTRSCDTKPCDIKLCCDDPRNLLQYIGWQATPVDVIAHESKQSISMIMQWLLELELQGVIANRSGGYMKVRGTIK